MEYQRVYAKIDISAIEKNIAGVRRRISDSTKIMAIVKADAYGHGSAVLASEIERAVDWFGVSNVSEAVELRRAGVASPILVLGHVDPCEFSTSVKNNVTLAMFDYTDAKKLSETAAKFGKTVDIHIKVDTGMSRIGYSVCERSADEVARIVSLPNLSVTGIFTHFARADESDKSSAETQINAFELFNKMLADRGVTIPIRHTMNSAGIMELDTPYEMVRMGIMLYGQYPSDEMDRSYKLYPAMQLISSVSMVKSLDAGVGISYGHTYVTDKPTKVATVPVGYADGYPRCLSNKGHVLIGGKRCPVVGRVCMDQMMVDVSELNNVSVGDEVVLFGEQNGEYLSCDEVAAAANTISYELLCSISRRVPRVYYKNGESVKTVSYII